MSFINYISRTYCASVDGLNIILLGSWRKKSIKIAFGMG